MKYHKKDDKYFVRLIKGENVFSSFYDLLVKENIKTAWINGIGAIENVTIGSYNLNEKKYYKKKLEGVYEIVSLSGNFSFKDGKPFLHFHVTLTDNECRAWGGHLFSGYINATGEFIIIPLDISTKRIYDDNTGLHLMEFDSHEK